MDHQQQVVEFACKWIDQVSSGRRDAIDGVGFVGILHVDDGKSLGEDVPDKSMTPVDDPLHAVGAPAALVGMADDDGCCARKWASYRASYEFTVILDVAQRLSSSALIA